MASVFLFLFALAYSWRTIVFHVFLLPHSSKKNCFELFNLLYQLSPPIRRFLSLDLINFPQFIVLTFPQIFRDFSDSLIHCSLAVALYCTPRKYPQSLFYVLNMHRVRRRAPERFRISSIGAKARALAMFGVSQHLGGEDLLPGANQNPFSIRFLLDVQCLGIWRFPVSFFLRFTT